MNWSIQIPEKPNPTFVLVTNISPTTSDKVVKEFFLFCGKIIEFEVQNDETTNTRTALIQFEKGSSSKTAIMLSNAMIGDRHIQVRGYFDQDPSNEQNSSRATGQDGNEQEFEQPGTSQDKSFKVTSFMSDFLSSSYELSDQLFKKAQSIDSRYGISTAVGTYTELAKQEALKLDQKLQVSQRAVNLDQQFKLTQRLDQVAKSAIQLGQDALKTEPGKKVSEVIHVARDKLAQVHQESLSKMEAQRRAKELGTPAHPTEAGAQADTTTSTLYNAEIPPQYAHPEPASTNGAEPSQVPAPAPETGPSTAPVDEKAALKTSDQ